MNIYREKAPGNVVCSLPFSYVDGDCLVLLKCDRQRIFTQMKIFLLSALESCVCINSFTFLRQQVPNERIHPDFDSTTNRACRGGRRVCGGRRRQRAVGSGTTRIPNPAGANRAGFFV